MLTDVQTPFLGTRLVPLKLGWPASGGAARRLQDDGAVSSDDEKEQFVDKDFPAEKSSIGAKGTPRANPIQVKLP